MKYNPDANQTVLLHLDTIYIYYKYKDMETPNCSATQHTFTHHLFSQADSVKGNEIIATVVIVAMVTYTSSPW